MVRVPFKKTVSWTAVSLILSWHFFPATVCAQAVQNEREISLAIWPISDGSNDDVSNDTAAALREALPHVMSAHVVSEQIIQKVLSYYGREDPGKQETAADELASAKEHYFGFQYEEAMAEVARAVEILSSGNISVNGALLQDALITQGIIARSAGNESLAKSAFDRAVRLNPFYRLDYRAFPPSIVEIFEKSRNEIMQGENGALRIETDPLASEVFINGVLQGVTPLDFPRIPAGSYSVLVKTNKYEALEKEIKISNGEKAFVREKLKWIGENAKSQRKQKEDAKAEISEGLRIADLLKVDKAVIIDCDKSGIVNARMVDGKYHAAHRPIVVEFDADGKAQAIADLTRTIANLAQINLLSNPMKYLDPYGLGDPILLSGRKRELYKKPIFWGAIGTAAAGAIIGGILAATSGGSSSDRGSIAVQFK